MIETPPKSRDDAGRIRELEELWALPARRDRRPSRARAAAIPEAVLPHIGKLLAAGWVGFFAMGAFAPAAETEAATPLWAGILIGGLFVGLLGALALSPVSGRAALGAAMGAGGFGIALAVGCRATEHHGGSWWAYELGATVLLTGLAALGFKLASRKS